MGSRGWGAGGGEQGTCVYTHEIVYACMRAKYMTTSWHMCCVDAESVLCVEVRTTHSLTLYVMGCECWLVKARTA